MLTAAAGEAGSVVSERAGARWLALALRCSIAVSLGLALLAVVTAGRAWLVVHLPDDAYYYFEIGRRLADGQGATFDGIHRTNGFHPLWQGVVALLATVLDGPALVKGALVVGWAMVVGALLVLRRLLTEVVGEVAALAAVAVAAHGAGLLLLLDQGMETPAVVLALALLALALRRWAEAPSDRRAAWVGVALGAVALARIDFLLVTPLLALAVLLRGRSVRAVVVVAVASAAVVGPFLAWNLATFGSPVTVSGTVKLHQMDERAEALGGRTSPDYVRLVLDAGDATVEKAVGLVSVVPGGSPAVELAVLAAAVAGGVWAARASLVERRGRPAGARSLPATWALAVVSLLVLAKSCLDHALLPLWAGDWYAAPFYLLCAMALGVGLAAAADGLADRTRQPAFSWLVVLAALPLTWSMSDDPDLDPANLQAAFALSAGEIAEEVPDGRLGVYDAGLLGFELHPRPVVNLDGLVNDMDLADAIADGVPVLERARSRGVELVAGFFPPGDARLPACAEVVWQSDFEARYRDVGTGAVSSAPIVVATLDTCPDG